MKKGYSFKIIIIAAGFIFFAMQMDINMAAGPSRDEEGVRESATPKEKTRDRVGKSNPFQMVLPQEEKTVQKAGPAIIQPSVEIPRPDLFVETIMLRFLKASNMETVAANLSSEYGKVAVDKETNSLIICDTKEKLQAIIAELRKADKLPKQILIEVVIVDVKLDDDVQVGVNWENLLGDQSSGNLISKQTLINDIGSSMTYPGAKIGILNNNANDIDVTLHALQQTRDVEILASPRVLVVSGQEASIETIEEIPYTELTQSTGGVGSSDAVTSTKFKDVGIKLTVKAVITDEERILLTIEPEQSVNTGVAGLGQSSVPIVDKRKAKTTLLMDNKQVLVFGGLRKKETRLSKDKIPLLGDIPLIGFLFSSDRIETLESELIVFIRPKIQETQELTEKEKERFEELRNKEPLEIKNPPRVEFEAAKKAFSIFDREK